MCNTLIYSRTEEPLESIAQVRDWAIANGYAWDDTFYDHDLPPHDSINYCLCWFNDQEFAEANNLTIKESVFALVVTSLMPLEEGEWY